MNIYQGINSSSILFVLGGIVLAFAQAVPDNDIHILHFLKTNVGALLLALFIIIFKIKTLFDDHKHFGEKHQVTGNIFRVIGFILGILSWIFLAIASYKIFNNIQSAEFIIVSLLISSAWLIIHLIEILVDKNRRIKEIAISLMREKWVLINIIYMLLLISYIGWFEPVVTKQNNSVLIILNVFLILDYFTSRSNAL